MQEVPGTRVIRDFLSNETDGLFEWQFNGKAQCPTGCARKDEGRCMANGELGSGNTKQEL